MPVRDRTSINAIIMGYFEMGGAGDVRKLWGWGLQCKVVELSRLVGPVSMGSYFQEGGCRQWVAMEIEEMGDGQWGSGRERRKRKLGLGQWWRVRS